jgi:glycosyltransferase involved in cell wall biosynthesis
MRDEVVATGYPAEHVVVIPNGCDIELFSDHGAGATLRARYPWLGGRPLVLFSGTFGAVTGADYLVRLATAAERLDPDIRIVGVGDGGELERTRRLAAEAGVLNRSLFLLGKLSKTEVLAWVNAADIGITLLTGPEIVWRDAVQNKFFDALAAGKPMAANFLGYQSKVAVEAGAGIVLSSTDIEQAAHDIVRTLHDRDWLASAGRAARCLAETRFSRDQLAIKLVEVLEDAHMQRSGQQSRGALRR